MVKAQSVLTRLEDVAGASAEIARGLAKVPDLYHVLLIATSHFTGGLGHLADEVKRTTGAARVAACSGIGVLTEAGEIEEQPGVSALGVGAGAPLSFALGSISPERENVNDLARFLLGQLEPVTPLAALILITGPEAGWPEDLIEALQSAGASAPIFGGGLHGSGTDESPRIVAAGEGHGESVLLVGIGRGLQIAHGFSQAMSPREETYVITRAQGPQILELEGRPAQDVLRAAVGEAGVAGLAAGTYPVFLGFPMTEASTTLTRGNYLVRTLTGIHPRTGGLITTQPPRVGERVGFVVRDLEAARTDMRRMAGEVATDARSLSPAFGFYVNCCARGKDFYGQPDVDTSLLREFLPGLPLVGFFGSFEICPVGGRQPVHGYTGVLVVVG